MNMFEMMGMMGKVKDIQANIQKAKENLVYLTASAESGAGLVKATVNGARKLVKLDVDPSLLLESEKEMLQDLTIAAINLALVEMDVIILAEMKKATDGLLPNIPGMDLGSLLGGN